MCRSKEEGGMGFINMSKFNTSLLAKQGWRIMNNADYLVAKVLKAKYFPNDQFLNSKLGNSSSYTSKSIWAAKDILRKGLIWRVGTGNNISINYDAWMPDAFNFRLSSEIDSMRNHFVHMLIDSNERKWKEELIKYTFVEEDTGRILYIPLASNPHNDFLAWGGEALGEFSVCSAYQLLQNTDENPRAYALQISYRKLYKKLWLLNLPTKIKIITWKITWNFLHTKVNLQHKKLVDDPSCRRCREQVETIDHLFRECPVAVEIWSTLLLQNVLLNFNSHTCRIFCCAFWAIWGDRNSRIHDKKVSTGTEIGNFIINYIAELDGLESKKSTKIGRMQSWRHPPRESVKINFDGAFDGHNNTLASGIVVRDNEGSIILSCSGIHKGVPSAFVAEVIACRKTVKIGVENTWPEVIIKGDSLTVIKKCRNKDQDRSVIGAYILDIKNMAYRSKHFVFKHISRIANTLAHKLATESLRRKEGIYLEEIVPEYAENQRLRESVPEPD
ncbi:reverse transcriptase [Gossypium australe]|uniref:Reverse transcriptase n=1 Tax=Gossypium australe TaxID=47621 RepID=A0A5B6WFS9_9ROSI|nr:reverse transcriptase [Gossypium australe]